MEAFRQIANRLFAKHPDLRADYERALEESRKMRAEREREIRRNSRVQVGDLLVYRYTSGHWSGRTTRAVIEVLDGGATFVVDGGYHVSATQILAHIPAAEESVTGDR